MYIGSYPTTTQEDLMISSLQKLQDLDRYLKVETSEEGLNKLLVSLIDTFGQLLQTFKTNVFKFYRGLKRSELKAYVESNMLQMKLIAKANYIDIKDVKIVAPNGLTSTYMQVTEDLNIAYTIADVISISKVIADAIQQSCIDLQDGRYTNFKALQSTLLAKGKKAQQVSSKLHKNFNDKATDRFKFSEKFNSIQELIDVKNLLIDMESRLIAIAGLDRTLDRIDSNLGTMLDLIQDTKTPTTPKTYIKELSTIVRSAATMFEGYAAFVEIHMALEHNLTYVLKDIYKEIV